jgi:hypothetical protein
MATDNNQPQAPSSESLEAGYERSTISVKGLAWFLLVLIATAVVIHIGVWYLYRDYVRSDERSDRPFSALTDPGAIDQYNRSHGARLGVTAAPQPPPPRIQPTAPEHNLPADDLRQMHQSEDEIFRRMGWTVDSQTHAQIRIPPQVVSAVIREESQRQQAGEQK